MPQVVVQKKASNAPRLIGVVVAVVLLVVIVVVVMMLKTVKPDTQTDTKTTVLKAQGRSFAEDYDGAIAVLQDQLKVASTDDEKLTIHTAIGSNYESKKDYKTALAEFQKAQAIRHTYGTDSSVARAAEESGDKATALTNYKLCQKGIKDGTYGPHRGDLDGVEAAIGRVGGTP